MDYLKQQSQSKTQKKFSFKPTFMSPRSIAGVPFDSVRRFRASLLLQTPLVCISVVIELQIVWWYNKPKTKKPLILSVRGRASNNTDTIFGICVVGGATHVVTRSSHVGVNTPQTPVLTQVTGVLFSFQDVGYYVIREYFRLSSEPAQPNQSCMFPYR